MSRTSSIIVLVVLALLAIGAGHAFSVRPAPHVSQMPQGTQTATTTAAAPGALPFSSGALAQSSPASNLPQVDIVDVRASILGSWQSTDDSKYTIKVGADGSWTDSYGSGSSATETGTYSLFTSDEPDPDFTDSVVPGVTYLKVVEGKSTFYYAITAMSATHLGLNYVDRGNTLSFVKVK